MAGGKALLVLVWVWSSFHQTFTRTRTHLELGEGGHALLHVLGEGAQQRLQHGVALWLVDGLSGVVWQYVNGRRLPLQVQPREYMYTYVCGAGGTEGRTGKKIKRPA